MNKQQEKKKRQLELSSELDDSIASIRSDLLANKEPTMKDIAFLLLRLIDKSESSRAIADDANERARLVEHNCQQLHRRMTEMETKNEEKEKEFKEMERKTNNLEYSLNKLDQQRVDNDIFLSGFPIKPDCQKVAAKLTELYGIKQEMIADCYQFEIKSNRSHRAGPIANSTLNKKETSYHHVVISLREKQTKFELMRKKKEINGPLLYEQIDGNSKESRVQKAVIRCTHRLTRFNLAVQSLLIKAKNDGKLQMFQLHNGLFRYKKDESSKWIIIDTQTSLNKFSENLISQ